MVSDKRMTVVPTVYHQEKAGSVLHVDVLQLLYNLNVVSSRVKIRASSTQGRTLVDRALAEQPASTMNLAAMQMRRVAKGLWEANLAGREGKTASSPPSPLK